MPPKRKSKEQPKDAKDAKKVKAAAARADFMKVYDVLRDELMENEIIAGQPEAARTWVKRMLDYNVPGGKLNRGMAVLDSLRACKGGKAVSEKEAFLANALGWCIEWLQAFFLVADDIMDNSVTRRGQPCWYKVPDVEMIACNDCILLETCIYEILRKHFKGRKEYLQLMELFHETTFQTSSGQLLDLITAPIGTVDLSKYTMETYMRIVTYKTAFYTIYMPVACGMILAGVKSEKAFDSAKEICIEMGQFFQIQDDYLDNFGDPEVIGKVGTDIEDNKCSWLVVQAMEKATAKQQDVLRKNYGKDDKACVAKIKALYNDLGLEAVFKTYEEASYKKLTALIKKQKLVPEEVYMAILSKIYKREK